jgi:putative oxidoreductase
LFSTFPDGWPGRGLLLLRLGAGAPLLYFGITGLLAGRADPGAVAEDLVAAAGGMLLLAGLWTPLAGALIAIDELWIASTQHFTLQGDPWIHILLAIMSGSVAMLGPGAWSIDAYVFGRKRFDIGGRTRR